MVARAFLAATFLLVSVSLSAQENETKGNISYSNITEFGFLTASPKGVAFEATTAHGVSFDKAHHLGLGIGIGTSMGTTTYDYAGYSSTETRWVTYMPVFVNYRFYFKPEKSFSPHVNVAVGGLIPREEYMGLYSSITMGFRAGKFSFSSGISMLAIQRENFKYVEVPNWWGGFDTQYVSEWKWAYPFGITLKWGFSF